MRFFTSDTHISHRNIMKFEPDSRPFNDIADMNEQIVERWNSVVRPSDIVYHLGDVALGPVEEWDGVLSRLNGHKQLIIGNHDRIFAKNKQSYIDRFEPVYEQWFENAASFAQVKIGDTLFIMSHFPYDGDHEEVDRYSDMRVHDLGLPLIHGHVHGQSKFTRSSLGTPQIHVGADAWDFEPVNEETILDLYNSNK